MGLAHNLAHTWVAMIERAKVAIEAFKKSGFAFALALGCLFFGVLGGGFGIPSVWRLGAFALAVVFAAMFVIETYFDLPGRKQQRTRDRKTRKRIETLMPGSLAVLIWALDNNRRSFRAPRETVSPCLKELQVTSFVNVAYSTSIDPYKRTGFRGKEIESIVTIQFGAGGWRRANLFERVIRKRDIHPGPEQKEYDDWIDALDALNLAEAE